MSEMGSHDPFGHLKHKLWQKKWLGVKLAVWLSTTKSRELTRFPCVHVACNMSLESSQRGLQLYFKTHLHWRFSHKVMGPQSRRRLNFNNFGQNDIWMWASWRSTKYIIRGKVVASPRSKPWWVLWIRVVRGFS